MQSPHPPILVGGQGRRRSAALAATFADEYNTDGLSPAEAAEAYGRVKAACEMLGRDPATITCSAVVALCCGRDSHEVARRRALIEDKCWTDPTEILGNGAVGTPAQIVERLGTFRDAGADRVYLQLFDLLDLDHLCLVADEVMTHLT
jgi:alkanesulfonate monooxygenase